MKKLLIAFVVTLSLVAINSNANAKNIRISGSFSMNPPTTPGGPHVLTCDPGDTCGWLNDEIVFLLIPIIISGNILTLLAITVQQRLNKLKESRNC